MTKSDETDKTAMWPEIEATFWSRIKLTRDEEDKKMAAKYEEMTGPIKELLADLLARRQDLLAKLQEIDGLCADKQEQIDEIDDDYQEAVEVKAGRRKLEDEKSRAWFRANRDGASEPGDEHSLEDKARQAEDKTTTATETSQSSGTNGHAVDGDETEEEELQRIEEARNRCASLKAGKASLQEASATAPADGEPTGAEVWGPDDNLIGPLMRISRDNHWIQRVLQHSVKRPIVVRRGRKFTTETLNSVYEPSDTKGAKWLSCMIQATGYVQDQPCHSCAKQGGTWSECVIIGGDDFPRCANCEWNRQGCHGSSYHRGEQDLPGPEYQVPPQSPKSDPRLSEADNAWDRVDGGTPSSGFMPVNGSSKTDDSGQSRSVDSGDSPPKRTTLPNKRPSRKSAPGQLEGQFGVEWVDDEDEDAPTFDPGPDITRDRLALRDNGVVFTEPEIMRGVPLKRITPDDPYWDPEWKSVEDLTIPKLEAWEEKLRIILSENKNRFLANRQVNRGKTILSFLQTFEIHPYQFVGKQWISSGLVSYDTLFRLAQVMEELPKFGVDVTPLQWLRQRMHELYTEQGDQFNLAKTVHNLYHDPKLIAIRSKAGYGNIGRPSGLRKGSKRTTDVNKSLRSREDLNRSPADDSRKRRRQSPSSLRRDAGSEFVMTPRNPHKRQRVDQSGSSSKGRHPSLSIHDEDDDLDYDGYTSHDSYSNDTLMKTDWRVHQIKTPFLTTNPRHTQYWHYCGSLKTKGPESEDVFEHQVLRDVSPPNWAVYKEPLDFHLRMQELVLVEYAPDCHYIVVHTKRIPNVKYRDLVLAYFKRERTMKRFLLFLCKKGVAVKKSTKGLIEEQWNSMESEVMATE